MIQRSFRVNGLEINAQFGEQDVDKIYLPLLRKLSQMQKEKGKRLIVLLAAPPAAGKSTLCCYLEALSRECAELTPVQCVGLDGFHYPNSYLDAHSAIINGREIPLRLIKGSPESFDVSALAEKLTLARENDVFFPIYDRRIHDPLPDAVQITEKILIVEGNWLLLDEGAWRDLTCDYSIFLRMGDENQLERIVRRKMQGGISEKEALRSVRENDWPNICRCMAHSRRGDLNLAWDINGNLVEI